MSLKKLPEFTHFLTTYISNADESEDEKSIQSFVAASSSDQVAKVLSQAKEAMTQTQTLVEELGMEANRWFGDVSEAVAWIEKLVTLLRASDASSGAVVVKDSNGIELLEGDSVQVIKDLKVKGGSSDLKRGDLIKKIHLIGDPDNIECRVGGSTLVLKTMFLKKV